MSAIVKFIVQTALLTFIYVGCKWLVGAFNLPIPANVLGIIILFSLLMFGIIKEEHIQEAAGFFLKHLVFFFVPIGVGLMEWGQTFYDYGFVLILALLVSLILPFFVVGKLMQKAMKEND